MLKLGKAIFKFILIIYLCKVYKWSLLVTSMYDGNFVLVGKRYWTSERSTKARGEWQVKKRVC